MTMCLHRAGDGRGTDQAAGSGSAAAAARPSGRCWQRPVRRPRTSNSQPGQRAVVGTGVCIALPDGYAAFVHPRSGLAARHGVTIVNAPGTVDAGYRGEIKVILLNTDAEHPVRSDAATGLPSS